MRIILTSNIGVKEVASFGKTWGLNQSLLKEDNKARLIIEKALKKNLDQNLIVLMKQLF
jgi:hypothetical protein